ncbi:cytochrome b5-like heme/steroid binding domain-containing protein [Dipodascopsis tothii]|uniref:cytochrome b5-like heme/steroid binding domain-containing protein n=1 Tax=Dipodascopsis tothii TaxID=44089 RepID=UPI0034CD0F93
MSLGSYVPQSVQAWTELPYFYGVVNALLIAALLYMSLSMIFPGISSEHKEAEKAVNATQTEPIVFTRFTPKTLAPFTGENNPGTDGRVLIGIRGNVYDVTAGRSFYGPGGPYSNFAGRDASRGLANGSFDLDMLTPIDQPLDTLKDLGQTEISTLNDWEDVFRNKYMLCGELVNETVE